MFPMLPNRDNEGEKLFTLAFMAVVIVLLVIFLIMTHRVDSQFKGKMQRKNVSENCC